MHGICQSRNTCKPHCHTVFLAFLYVSRTPLRGTHRGRVSHRPCSSFLPSFGPAWCCLSPACGGWQQSRLHGPTQAPHCHRWTQSVGSTSAHTATLRRNVCFSSAPPCGQQSGSLVAKIKATLTAWLPFLSPGSAA